MMTFSTSAMSLVLRSWSLPHFTLYSSDRVNARVARRALEPRRLPPALRRSCAAGSRRSRRGSVGSQNENARYTSTATTASPALTPKRREGADHAALHPADPARERQQVAEHADEVGHHDHRPGRRVRRRRGTPPTASRCRSPTRRPRRAAPGRGRAEAQRRAHAAAPARRAPRRALPATRPHAALAVAPALDPPLEVAGSSAIEQEDRDHRPRRRSPGTTVIANGAGPVEDARRTARGRQMTSASM